MHILLANSGPIDRCYWMKGTVETYHEADRAAYRGSSHSTTAGIQRPKYCSDCGEPSEICDRFCNACGAALEPIPVLRKDCSCGRTPQVGEVQCRACGRTVIYLPQCVCGTVLRQQDCYCPNCGRAKVI